ncbi:uncharacterized protein LOC115396645 [Salarias fasciatus]|uniref:uncharacterized protein LOC115396645 n=1 Tax=Salarias fasciatus TaxID=181472 RepID=UPI0011765EC9|nr:uncharacterized protein LOC115396645 [Salarias fasciatus]XP_029958478.1 uncharacterized protein LOC115396645 [Salarias fasciatus]
MAHPEDDFDRNPEKNSKAVHTQESGYEGLSSNMKHKCYDDAEKNPQPVDKDSFVRPIHKEEGCTAKLAVELPVLAHVVRHDEEGLLKKPVRPTFTQVQKSKTDITAVIADKEMVKGSRLSVAMKVNGSAGRLHMKRGKRKEWKLFLQFCLFVHLLQVNRMFAAGLPLPISDPGLSEQKNNTGGWKCVICNDMARCPNLTKIFDQDDKKIFKRAETTQLPLCTDSPELHLNICSVCRYQGITHIYCPDNIKKLEAEDDQSHILGPISNITEGCQPLPTSNSGLNEQKHSAVGSGRQRHGIILAFTILALCCAGFYCWKKRGQLACPASAPQSGVL